MPNRLTSANCRKWQAYNRWRARNRAADAQRRLANVAARKAALVADYPAPHSPLPPMPSPVAVIRITFAGGKSASFRIRDTPHGWSISPTTAGRRVAELLKAALCASRSR